MGAAEFVSEDDSLVFFFSVANVFGFVDSFYGEVNGNFPVVAYGVPRDVFIFGGFSGEFSVGLLWGEAE